MTRAKALGAAHDDLARAMFGKTIPCQQGQLWQAFISEDPDERAEAAQACAPCPVIDQCRSVGQRERFGVWGGRDRTREACQ